MGINTGIGTLLTRARRQGVHFGDTLTIGRQSLTIPAGQLARIAGKYGVAKARGSRLEGGGWADEFLIRFLDAESVSSMDYSEYEAASIVHDLNTPVPPDLHERFDVVIDGGTIEHVFDVKQTLENYMNLVKVGGSLFIAAPANNLCGHGFYQFSPEFFYRVFSRENGYSVREMFLIESPLLETSRHLRYFHVNDPEKVRKRVELLNSRPVMLFVHAERLSSVPLFSTNPYQSDYRAHWDAAADSTNGDSAGHTNAQPPPFKQESRWKEFRRRLRHRRKNGLRRGRFFDPFEP